MASRIAALSVVLLAALFLVLASALSLVKACSKLQAAISSPSTSEASRSEAVRKACSTVRQQAASGADSSPDTKALMKACSSISSAPN